MTIAQEYAERIAARLPLLKSGTLRIWGQWFGRPYDNMHIIMGASADQDKLVLSFNEGETLTIYNPDRGVFVEAAFKIESAKRVRWEWYYYGMDRLPENLHFLDYISGSNGFSLRTNWQFSKVSNHSPTGPAVEFL